MNSPDLRNLVGSMIREATKKRSTTRISTAALPANLRGRTTLPPLLHEDGNDYGDDDGEGRRTLPIKATRSKSPKSPRQSNAQKVNKAKTNNNTTSKAASPPRRRKQPSRTMEQEDGDEVDDSERRLEASTATKSTRRRNAPHSPSPSPSPTKKKSRRPRQEGQGSSSGGSRTHGGGSGAGGGGKHSSLPVFPVLSFDDMASANKDNAKSSATDKLTQMAETEIEQRQEMSGVLRKKNPFAVSVSAMELATYVREMFREHADWATCKGNLNVGTYNVSSDKQRNLTFGMDFEFANSLQGQSVPHYALSFGEQFQKLLPLFRYKRPKPRDILWVRQEGAATTEKLHVRNDQVVASLLSTDPDLVRTAVLATFHHYPDLFLGVERYIQALRFINMKRSDVSYNSSLMWGLLSHMPMRVLRSIWFMVMQTRPRNMTGMPVVEKQTEGEDAQPKGYMGAKENRDNTEAGSDQDDEDGMGNDNDNGDSGSADESDNVSSGSAGSNNTKKNGAREFFDNVVRFMPNIRKLPYNVDNVIDLQETTSTDMGREAPRNTIQVSANPGRFVLFRADNRVAPGYGGEQGHDIKRAPYQPGDIQHIPESFFGILKLLSLMIVPQKVATSGKGSQNDLPESYNNAIMPLCQSAGMIDPMASATQTGGGSMHNKDDKYKQDVLQTVVRAIRGHFKPSQLVYDAYILPQRSCYILWKNINQISALPSMAQKYLVQQQKFDPTFVKSNSLAIPAE